MPGERILVVDDNPINLRLALTLLRAEGYDTRAASDAAEALGALEHWQPRLILMDIQMPGMDGLELTRRLKADPRTREITIIAVSAYAMKGDAERAQAAGCDGYVAKPIDTRTLPQVLAAYLSPSQAAES